MLYFMRKTHLLLLVLSIITPIKAQNTEQKSEKKSDLEIIKSQFNTYLLKEEEAHKKRKLRIFNYYLNNLNKLRERLKLRNQNEQLAKIDHLILSIKQQKEQSQQSKQNIASAPVNDVAKNDNDFNDFQAEFEKILKIKQRIKQQDKPIRRVIKKRLQQD